MNNLETCLSATLSAKHWGKIGRGPHHGIVLPLFSLKSQKSSGIGEYPDLIRVIDWCQDIGFDVIQLLPLNEPLFMDPSPYNPISSCALNPLHISLRALVEKNNNKIFQEKLDDLKILNTYPRINYFQLYHLKMNFLKEYYLFIFDDLKKDKNFEIFIKDNPWLDEYCVFKIIQRMQDYKTWDLWPKKLQEIDESSLSWYKEKHQDEVNFYRAIQYLCFEQLKEVKRYADQKNVFLMGDLPILLSKNSCDVWYNKSIFDLNLTAGAPPDSFNQYGQKWYFPLFNWDLLEKTHYYWWKRRLNAISDLYHMYRIDHAVGFFRLWCMRLDQDPIQGKYIPEDPSVWQANGKERLIMLLNSSSLLPLAEDLGTIPQIVYKTLKELGICGTKVIFWQKEFSEFIKFNNYEPLSITTLSTHDSLTFQGWWQTCEKEAVKFAQFKNWNYAPHLSYLQRKELLKDAHNTPSIFHINLLQEYLALYPELVWPDPEDERINIPGTVNLSNWTYRFKPFFEEITEHKQLRKDLKDILSK